MPENGDEEWRGRIDTDMHKFGERLVGVESGVSALGRSFDKFSHSFDATVQRQQELQKTRWPLVFGVLSLVVVVIGAFMSGYLRDLNRIEADVLKIQSHRISENDPVQDTVINDNRAEIVAIRLNEHATVLNDATIATQIKELMTRKEQILAHMMDGHPGTMERMETHQNGMIREMEGDLQGRITRDLELHQREHERMVGRLERVEEHQRVH
jgi:hypothetical protein